MIKKCAVMTLALLFFACLNVYENTKVERFVSQNVVSRESILESMIATPAYAGTAKNRCGTGRKECGPVVCCATTQSCYGPNTPQGNGSYTCK